MPESTALGSRFRPPARPAFGIAALFHTLPAAFAYYFRIVLPPRADCLDRSKNASPVSAVNWLCQVEKVRDFVLESSCQPATADCASPRVDGLP